MVISNVLVQQEDTANLMELHKWLEEQDEIVKHVFGRTWQ